MIKKFLIMVLLVALVVTAWVVFDLHRYFGFYYIQTQQAIWAQAVQENPVWVAVVFFGIYVLVTALSLPGATVMTLAAGGLFGLGWGTLFVSFASSIGATLAFVITRFFLRDWVQKRFQKQLATINRGAEEEGAFYLFSLRLIPVFPFFLVNLVMALTPIRGWTFYWVSQLGMLAGTLVYVNAGTQLAQLKSMEGILSPALILSFVVLGVFPLAAKKILQIIRAQKAHE